MSNVILDASALLALTNGEPGGEHVEKHLGSAIMSCVSVSEVTAILCDLGINVEQIRNAILTLVSNVEDFDAQQAYTAGILRPLTKKYGLSLGDRACLALAMKTKCKVLTADKAWSKLKLDVDIEVIR